MPESDKKKVLFAASEVYPFAKSGGLADVAASLPKALAHEFEIDVLLPLYGSIDVEKYRIVPLQHSYTISMNQQNYKATQHGCRYGGISYYFVQSPCISEKSSFTVLLIRGTKTMPGVLPFFAVSLSPCSEKTRRIRSSI